MFNSTQQDLFNNVNEEFGSQINLTEGGNSYIFYNLMSKIIDLANQYGVEQLNKFSIFSAILNFLNGLGYLLNYPRPYNPFIISGATIFSSGTTVINAGFQISFTNSMGQVLNFITEQNYTPDSSGNVVANFYYTGINQVLEDIPSGTSFAVYTNTGGAGGALVETVTSNSDASPTQIDDQPYRTSIKTIYQSSSNGIDGAIQIAVSNLTGIVASCRVYIGTNPSAPTNIVGVDNTYALAYGQLLIVVDFVTTPPAVSPPFYPAAILIVAQTIRTKLNYLNQMYDGSFSNEITVPITTAAGNIIDIIFYTALSLTLNIVLNISASSQIINDSIQSKFKADINNYINAIPIAGSLYFSQISQIALNYNLTLTSMEINSTDNVLQLTALPDQYFVLGTFELSYA